MIGACSTFLPKLIIEIYPDQKIGSWQAFLQQLKSMIDDEKIRDKVYLVCDNMSSHRSEDAIPYYEPFHVLFLPPYSSFLNPQERVWSLVKLELAKYFARFKQELKTKIQYESEVSYVLD